MKSSHQMISSRTLPPQVNVSNQRILCTLCCDFAQFLTLVFHLLYLLDYAGTDFFTFHLLLGGLTTQPTTVAITVSSNSDNSNGATNGNSSNSHVVEIQYDANNANANNNISVNSPTGGSNTPASQYLPSPLSKTPNKQRSTLELTSPVHNNNNNNNAKSTSESAADSSTARTPTATATGERTKKKKVRKESSDWTSLQQSDAI